MATIKGKIRGFIEDEYAVQIVMNDVDLGDNDSIIATDIMDSLGVLALTTFLEDEFRVKVEDDEIHPDNLDSINKIEAFVNKKVNI